MADLILSELLERLPVVALPSTRPLLIWSAAIRALGVRSAHLVYFFMTTFSTQHRTRSLTTGLYFPQQVCRKSTSFPAPRPLTGSRVTSAGSLTYLSSAKISRFPPSSPSLHRSL